MISQPLPKGQLFPLAPCLRAIGGTPISSSSSSSSSLQPSASQLPPWPFLPLFSLFSELYTQPNVTLPLLPVGSGTTAPPHGSAVIGCWNTNNFYFSFLLFYIDFLFLLDDEEVCDTAVTWYITWCNVIGLEGGKRIWKMTSKHMYTT